MTNKKVKKLGKQLIGYDRWLGIIDFVLDIEKYRRRGSIRYIFAHKADPWVPGFVLLEEAEPHLREILVDGIGIIERYFDLSSEENLLRNLPTGYHRDDNWGPGVFYENWDGISHCLVALVLGNFDFVERYASPDFKTMGPKREVELSKILAALPELKRKFAETGSVI